MDLIDATALEGTWGLHDADLHRFEWDLVTAVVRLEVTILLGDRQQRWRDARVEITGVEYFIVESPNEQFDPAPWRIDAGRVRDLKKPVTLPDAPDGCWQCWIFCDEPNTLMYVCARDASLTWTGEEQTGSPRALLPGDEVPDPET